MLSLFSLVSINSILWPSYLCVFVWICTSTVVCLNRSWFLLRSTLTLSPISLLSNTYKPRSKTKNNIHHSSGYASTTLYLSMFSLSLSLSLPCILNSQCAPSPSISLPLSHPVQLHVEATGVADGLPLCVAPPQCCGGGVAVGAGQTHPPGCRLHTARTNIKSSWL